MIMRVLSFTAVMLAVAVFALPASAFIIDSFDDTQSQSASSGTPVDSGTLAGGMIGGSRDLTANWTSGPNTVDADVNSGSSSLLNISLGADTLGTVDVIYDGGGGGFAATDFTVGGTLNAIAMQIPFDDLPVDIEIVALSLTGTSALTLNPGGGIFAPTSLDYLFGSFVTQSGTGADFTAVTGLELHISPNFPATDLQIDFIETTFVPPPGVPEPSTYVLGAMGLLGLGLFLRRKRQG